MSYWMRGYYFPRKKDLDKWYCSWYSDNEVECRTAPRNRRFKRQNAAHVMSGRGRMQMPLTNSGRELLHSTSRLHSTSIGVVVGYYICL